MQYIGEVRNNRSITVFNEQHEELGALIYTSFFSNRAQITTSDNAMYDVMPTGFWLNKVEITQNGVPYASVKYKLGNGANIFFENGVSLTLRLKSIWRYEYSVLDSDEQEIGNVYVSFKWRTFRYTYEINLSSTTHESRMNIMLPFILAYCTESIRLRRR